MVSWKRYTFDRQQSKGAKWMKSAEWNVMLCWLKWYQWCGNQLSLRCLPQRDEAIRKSVAKFKVCNTAVGYTSINIDQYTMIFDKILWSVEVKWIFFLVKSRWFTIRSCIIHFIWIRSNLSMYFGWLPIDCICISSRIYLSYCIWLSIDLQHWAREKYRWFSHYRNNEVEPNSLNWSKYNIYYADALQQQK